MLDPMCRMSKLNTKLDALMVAVQENTEAVECAVCQAQEEAARRKTVRSSSAAWRASKFLTSFARRKRDIETHEKTE